MLEITYVWSGDFNECQQQRTVKPGFHSNATQAIAFEWKPGLMMIDDVKHHGVVSIAKISLRLLISFVSAINNTVASADDEADDDDGVISCVCDDRVPAASAVRHLRQLKLVQVLHRQ